MSWDSQKQNVEETNSTSNTGQILYILFPEAQILPISQS